jgi:hypothetical protein
VARCLGLSERTVVRRVALLYADGTLRATVVRNPARFPHLIPVALRIRCRPNKVRQVAQALARRPDTVWVDILGGGDEISPVFFLEGPEARNSLLLRICRPPRLSDPGPPTPCCGSSPPRSAGPPVSSPPRNWPTSSRNRRHRQHRQRPWTSTPR